MNWKLQKHISKISARYETFEDNDPVKAFWIFFKILVDTQTYLWLL